MSSYFLFFFPNFFGCYCWQQVRSSGGSYLEEKCQGKLESFFLTVKSASCMFMLN